MWPALIATAFAVVLCVKHLVWVRRQRAPEADHVEADRINRRLEEIADAGRAFARAEVAALANHDEQDLRGLWRPYCQKCERFLSGREIEQLPHGGVFQPRDSGSIFGEQPHAGDTTGVCGYCGGGLVQAQWPADLTPHESVRVLLENAAEVAMANGASANDFMRGAAAIYETVRAHGRPKDEG